MRRGLWTKEYRFPESAAVNRLLFSFPSDFFSPKEEQGTEAMAEGEDKLRCW